MKAWYIPSFAGDFRFEAKGKAQTTLTVEKPSLAEQEALKRFFKAALKKHWVSKANIEGAITLDAPLAEAGAEMASILNFKRAGVLTALKFENGKVEATEIIDADGLPRWMRKLEEKAKKTAEVAATVARPTLSCPECSGKPEGDRKACDVLWALLDIDQRKEWLKGRRFTAFGNLTGHAYDIAPRDTETAGKRGRICFDLDDRVILHNYNLAVPPEEEALAAKLILEHRENWLRVFGEVDPEHRASPGTVFENPLEPVWSRTFSGALELS